MAKDCARFADIYNLANTCYVSGQSKMDNEDWLRTDCGLLFSGLENNGTIVVTFHCMVPKQYFVVCVFLWSLHVFTSSCVTQEARTIIFETTMLLFTIPSLQWPVYDLLHIFINHTWRRVEWDMLKIEEYKRKKMFTLYKKFSWSFPHFEIMFGGINANVELRKLEPERTH